MNLELIESVPFGRHREALKPETVIVILLFSRYPQYDKTATIGETEFTVTVRGTLLDSKTLVVRYQGNEVASFLREYMPCVESYVNFSQRIVDQELLDVFYFYEKLLK